MRLYCCAFFFQAGSVAVSYGVQFRDVLRRPSKKVGGTLAKRNTVKSYGRCVKLTVATKTVCGADGYKVLEDCDKTVEMEWKISRNEVRPKLSHAFGRIC